MHSPPLRWQMNDVIVAIAKAKRSKWFALQAKFYAPQGIRFGAFDFMLCPAGHAVCQTGQSLSQKGHSVWGV